jgi:hypothetical protein|tara:strand:- start:38285 stop:39688 length:1404 start_codon:yes stop_codon:yes gene_type:complete
MRKNSKLRISKLILSTFIFPFIISCNQKNLNEEFYLGGEIINPSSRFVNFYYNNVKIDSIELNSENKFFKKIENINPGIYRIEHLPENQNIIVEKGDSLWIRVNVEDFHESLTFSGRGSSKNNFLVDINNMDTYENEYLSQYYVQESDIFRKKIDSLMNEKLRIWELFNKSVNQKKLSSNITKSSIKYNYYNKLERYAILRGTNWTKSKKESYFDYRDDINLNDTDLSLFDPYVTFLMNYFNEKTLDSGEIYSYVKNNTDFNIKKLLIIDSQIDDPYLKNNLARATAIEEILNFKNNKFHDEFIDYYSYVNSSDKYLNEIIQLYKDIKKMQKGNVLPEVSVINYQGKERLSSNELKGSKTLIYFWSQTQMNHYRRTIKRIEELKQIFPNFRFVGICIQPYTDMVIQAQNILNVDLSDQYSFKNFEESSKSWVLTFLNKTIIIDQKSYIIDGFSNLFTNDVEQVLYSN